MQPYLKQGKRVKPGANVIHHDSGSPRQRFQAAQRERLHYVKATKEYKTRQHVFPMQRHGIKDPRFVVIDEAAGPMIALIAVPLHGKYMLAGFILFRSFDIVKPFPLRRLEALPGGTGIMMDDVGAGLYALALLQLWLHFIAR